MSTPVPYETSVLSDLRRVLQEIRVANGYHTDAGGQVFTAAEKVDPQDEQIFLILDDAEEELRSQDGYVRDVTLRVDVQIFVALGREAQAREAARNLLHRVLSDVRRAVLQALRDQTFETLHTDVRLEGRSILPLEAGGLWATAIQPVAVDTREDFLSL
jgi:hypothetical protein